jgi:hypothetical protein
MLTLVVSMRCHSSRRNSNCGPQIPVFRCALGYEENFGFALGTANKHARCVCRVAMF